MLSLVIQRRKFGEKIQSDIKLKLPDGSEKTLRELFQGKPTDLLAAFRENQWTIINVSYIKNKQYFLTLNEELCLL
jgi:hypothetical protein